ncbi:unnamed protein product [Hydatigera taeniaeformis]|uniref:MgtE domain-containing protein n=1 Tax=Hydatigena taeniaeformis TaxID=6205 RepID=A0A0R3X880_HYDTA|nr:unnamed protein product [Hydatigera taeniaeformis]
MVFHKKNQQQVDDSVITRRTKSESLKYFRRGIHRNSDILLILLHSLFPLAIGAFLIAQEALVTANTSRTNILGYLTGSGGIVLQLTLIARTLAPLTAARLMDVLTICVAALQFLNCTVGALVFLVMAKKIYLVASVSLANSIFCILPAFLAVTSIIAESKGNKGIGRRRNEPCFASSCSRLPVVIKGKSNRLADSAQTSKVDSQGGWDVSSLRTEF